MLRYLPSWVAFRHLPEIYLIFVWLYYFSNLSFSLLRVLIVQFWIGWNSAASAQSQIPWLYRKMPTKKLSSLQFSYILYHKKNDERELPPLPCSTFLMDVKHYSFTLYESHLQTVKSKVEVEPAVSNQILYNKFHEKINCPELMKNKITRKYVLQQSKRKTSEMKTILK